VTTVGLVLGLLVAYAAGGLLVWRLWPARARPGLLIAALAWPLGLSVTSSAYFLWLVVSGGRASWFPPLESALLALAGWLAWRRRGRGAPLAWSWPRPSIEAAALSILVVALVTALLVVLRWAEVTPWGYWDAWARINLKARFLHSGGPDWSWIFRGDGIPHPDYPLLLECSVARLWRWAGGATPPPAQVLSVLCWLGSVGALFALVAHLRSLGAAAAAGVVLLCNRTDLSWAAMQYADFALATFFTAGAGVLVLASRGEGSRWWPLLGAIAGSAAWCKNEGLVFALLVALLALARLSAGRAPRGRSVAALGAGFLLGSCALLVQELGFAGRSSLFDPRQRSLLEDLADPERYRIVAEHLWAQLADGVAGGALLLALAALLLFPRGHAVERSWMPLGACLAMALAFLAVLVTTREDLEWHVGTTIDRLVLQLWPMATLAVTVGSPSERRATKACSSAS
jgi:hypothetical protein